ncbi:MAG: hypothetical protein QOI42_1859 [Frankiaceae bacterium]|nr:hypothetical protein [Frankiaceae bacterium]
MTVVWGAHVNHQAAPRSTRATHSSSDAFETRTLRPTRKLGMTPAFTIFHAWLTPMLRASATSGTDNATFSTLPAGPSLAAESGVLAGLFPLTA